MLRPQNGCRSCAGSTRRGCFCSPRKTRFPATPSTVSRETASSRYTKMTIMIGLCARACLGTGWSVSLASFVTFFRTRRNSATCSSRQSEDLVLDGDDIGDYYHHWWVSLQRDLSNAIGRLVHERELEGTQALASARARRACDGRPSPTKWQPCQATPPMGDLNAVDYAQTAHMNLIRGFGGLPDDTLLRYCAPVPRGPVWEGIIIDDRTVASKIPRCVRPTESPAIQFGPVAYEAVGLPRKLSKAFRGATNVEVWGARVDGREGTVRAKDDSVQRTVAYTMAVFALGVATVDIWQSVLGLWTHLLLFRRVAIGLLDEVYAFAPPADCAQAIPAAARDELLGLLALAPLLVSDMRAPVSTSVTAGDASPWACPGVETTLSEGAVRELWRFRDRKGGYIRCETDFEALVRDIGTSDDDAARSALAAVFEADGDQLPDLTAHEKEFSWVSELANGVGWRPQFRYRAKRLSEHINLKEARAYRSFVKRKARAAASHGARQLGLLDSAVVRGAAAKGRSSSKRLKGDLRLSASTAF